MDSLKITIMSTDYRRRFSVRSVWLCIVVLCAAQKALADDGDVLTLLIENDVIAATDQHYTNGLELSYLSVHDGVPGSLRPGVVRLPGVAGDDVMRFGVSLGQQIYTPDNIETAAPLPDERPYAGWLYLGLALVADDGNELDTWVLDLGVVGPSARGEEVQNGFHEAISGDHANGWDNQLHDEFGAALLYEHRWRNIYAKKFDGFGLDVSPHLGFSLGNVATYANGGLTLRLGNAVSTDYGVPRIRPSLPGSAFFDPTSDGLRWYVFAGVDLRGVAHNIFLDGNSDGDSLSVDKKPFVAELQSGFAIVWHRVRFAYTYVLRSKEFEAQNEPDRFASVGISYRF
jgi:lipid A 3-O-deacylase